MSTQVMSVQMGAVSLTFEAPLTSCVRIDFKVNTHANQTMKTEV